MPRKSVSKRVVAGLAVGLLGLGGCQDRSKEQQGAPSQEGTGGAGQEQYETPATQPGSTEQTPEGMGGAGQPTEEIPGATRDGGTGGAGTMEQQPGSMDESGTGGAGSTYGGEQQEEPSGAAARDGGSHLSE